MQTIDFDKMFTQVDKLVRDLKNLRKHKAILKSENEHLKKRNQVLLEKNLAPVAVLKSPPVALPKLLFWSA